MNRKGFTPIELLIVLMIIGIIFVTAFSTIKTWTGSPKQNPTVSLNTTMTLSTNDSNNAVTTSSTPSDNWQVSKYDGSVRYKQLTDYLFLVEYDGVIYVYNYQGGIIKHK
jgi:prepilin-type N-terminal cleavage/methylation domain-containing protein